MEMDYVDICGIIMLIIGIFICSPILIYALFRFHGIKNAAILKYRNVTLTYFINILVLFTIIIERSCAFYTCIWNIDNTMSKVSLWIAHIGYGVCVWSIYLLFAIKTWLLYYEQKYHLSLINQVWKRLINESNTSWYILNRHKYGDHKYLLKISIIPYILYIVVETLINIYLHQFSMVIQIIFTFINWILTCFPLIFACIIYYKFHSKQFKDVYNISNELKYECIVIIICLIAKTIFISVSLYLHSQQKIYPNLHRIEALFDLYFIRIRSY